MQGHTVWISGIRRGIGRAVAVGRAARGDVVCGFSRHGEGLPELASELFTVGEREGYLAAADLTDGASLDRFAAEALRRHGPPDVLIHCAAILGPRRPLAATGDGAWRLVLDVNVTGTARLLNAAAAAAEGRAGPKLVVAATSSVAAKGRSGWGAYAASKAAMENVVETFAGERGGEGWSVANLNPGGTRTDMRAEAYPDEDPETLPSPAVIAEAFDAVIARWEAGEPVSGERFNAREVLAL